MVALNVAHGEACIVRADGEDAEDAMRAIAPLVEQGFGETAGVERQEASLTDASTIPAGLRRLNVRWIAGRSISTGFARGPVVVMRSGTPEDGSRSAGDPELELQRVCEAIPKVRQQIEARLNRAQGRLERDLLTAHMAMADDPALRESIERGIRSGASASGAVREAAEHFKSMFKASASAYVRDRVIDVDDVCQQIVQAMGDGLGGSSITLREPSIIVANALTPRQLMGLDRSLTLGLALGAVGATSHTAILARASGIPAVIDLPDVESAFDDGRNAIVDAVGGFVLPEVGPEIERYYAIQSRALKNRREKLERIAATSVRRRNAPRLHVAANASTLQDIEFAKREGAEGIGLFRTEMLFLDRTELPPEEEQFSVYASAVKSPRERPAFPITFRTLDIGGDKPAPYLRLPPQENPFLGVRGIRIYERFADLLRSQLRAIIRASALGPVKVMAPMVSSVREAWWFVERVREVQNELRGERIAFARDMPVGVMIEVPSAAFDIKEIAKVVDFVSIGTNDLTQYFFSADRTNPAVGGLCDPLEPSFLRLLRTIVDGARGRKRWVGVCGEMAGETRNLELMVGLGVDEISISPARVLDLKAVRARLKVEDCRRAFKKAVSMRDASQVRALLAADRARGGQAIIDRDLVSIRSAATSKVEVIKELSEMAWAAGRVENAADLEEALWAREETFSTAIGFGFAVPHCKTDAVGTPMIALVKPATSIDWGSSDGEPVRVAIMLAIPAVAKEASRLHMELLARLARKLMHEKFRNRILSADRPESVVAALKSALQGD